MLELGITELLAVFSLKFSSAGKWPFDHNQHLGEVLYAVKHSEYFSISPDIHYAGHGLIAVGLCMYAVAIHNLLDNNPWENIFVVVWLSWQLRQLSQSEEHRGPRVSRCNFGCIQQV